MKIPSLPLLLLTLSLPDLVHADQIDLLSIEFIQDDQEGFDLWPSPFSGTRSTARFPSDPSVTSGSTEVTVTTSTSFGVPGNRGSSNGNPPGYSYQRLYEDLLIAISPTGFLTLDFSGLSPGQHYTLTLYAWDPGASDGSDKVWSVTGGTGTPSAASVNFQSPLIDNQSFALVYQIEASPSGTFQLTNTGGLSQSAINGFTLSAEAIDSDSPPAITSPPTAIWDGGEDLVIEFEVSGAEPFFYQWFLNGTPIPGANQASLTLDANEWDRDGEYTVRVSNANGFVDSDPADITIDIPPFPTREQLTYEPLGPSSRRTGITISEFLYHPARRTDNRELEFIELYNSQPWAEDLSGWRISGDVDYLFPEGTLIPAKGFLVIARSPGDLESETGISGTLGPWEGNLDNDGGRIRLRKPSDAIVLEIDYDDDPPWPAAADGPGHSLILARPSYGENDLRAWEASHSIGGSPGFADPVPSDDLDQIFILSVLSRSVFPQIDYVELRNSSPQPVDISGCQLSDSRDELGKFIIPSNTVIAPGEWLTFNEETLGFAFDSAGDAIYFTTPSGSRVLDATILPPGSPDTPFFKRRSDGPLRSLDPTVFINELMFHPPTHDSDDEWIEIYNHDQLPRNLSGWTFTDGIDFDFPEGTEIAPFGYLVIARNRARMLASYPDLDPAIVLGDFRGTLSNSGERIALASVIDGSLAIADEVFYRDKSRWHRFSDGRGASLERRARGSIPSHSPHWSDSIDSEESTWTTIEFTGTLAHGNSAAPADQIQMFLLGPGEALVDNVEVIPEGGSNILSNGDFESGTSGWFVQGNHRRSRLESGDSFEGSNSMRLVATRRGDPGPNRLRAPLTQTLTPGTKATLRAKVRWLKGHPEILLRFRGNWLEATGRLELPSSLGTPGAANSTAVDRSAPRVHSARHYPVLPSSGEDILVTAEISDDDGITPIVLKYRIDPYSEESMVFINDEGLDGDLTADDGIYSGLIPGQAAGTLIAFQINDLFDVPSMAFPPNGEALIRVGDPDSKPDFGTYRMWITQASLDDWDSQPFRSNDPFPITFVHNQSRVIYNAGAYYGGNRDSHSFPTSGSVSYDVALPDGEAFLGADKLTLDYPVRDPTNQREQLMHWFADQLRLPTLHRRDVYLSMNGIRRLQIYHDAEQPDGRLVHSHFPGDEGELFKTSNDNETSDSGVRTRPFVRNVIDIFEADGMTRAARYRWTTAGRARGSRTRLDDNSIIDLVTKADATGPDYERDLLEIIDMDNWMRTWALIDLASFWDAFGNPNWKNTYLYKPNGGKWVQFTWDFDVGLGVFNDPTNQALFPGNVDTNIRRMYDTPSFVRSYWRAMEESLGSFFSGASVTPILERKRAAYAAAGLSFTSPFSPSGPYNLPVTTWIDRRAAFIQPQLNSANGSFSVSSPPDESSFDSSSITLSGSAPINAVVIEVNGIPLDLSWNTTSEWTATFVLQPGENLLLIRALDSNEIELASDIRTVTYTGIGGWPSVVINEWMASNQSVLPDPSDGQFDDWIELTNPDLTPADLSGWFLSDDPDDPFQFQIPNGFFIPAGGFLLAWADDDPIQNNPPFVPDLHLPFKLSASGDSIILTAPDGSLIDRVDFARQSPDKTMGRLGTDTLALATPSPGETNGRAAVEPSASFTIDGNSLSFSIVTEPGFFYLAEVSDDLEIWRPLAEPVIAEAPITTFNDLLSGSNRYYRFRRIP
ncbi:MAG: lamin tail domain-containing protein [Akkermansiaceae bacterium]